MQNSAIQPLRGVALVQAANAVAGQPYVLVYTDSQTGLLSYSLSTDGVDFDYNRYAYNSSNGQPIYTDQNASTGESTSGVGAVVWGASLYISYVAANVGQVVITRADPIPGSTDYSFVEVYRDTLPGRASTAPAMAVYQNRLYLLYGTMNRSSVNNRAYTTLCTDVNNPANCSTFDSIATFSTQAGMAVFNNNLYFVQKENGSNNTLRVAQLGYNGVLISSSAHQVNDVNTVWRTPSRLSMVVWNGRLTFAAQEQAGNGNLCVYTGTYTINWTSQNHYGIPIGATSAIVAGQDAGGAGLTAAYRTQNAYTLTTVRSNP